MAKIYYDKDADLNLLMGKKVAVIGYGSQGHAQAQNLRDSGIEVIVSELEETANYQLALEHGFKPVDALTASQNSDIIQILIPDDAQAEMYHSSVAPYMNQGKTLLFSHGFNIHFHQITPPEGIDVFMVAPKGPGSLVRKMFLEGKGVPCLIAVYQNATGSAKDLALSYAKAIGGTRAGVIETTFREETETDLFGEQAVLCGGVDQLIRRGFKVLVEAGYPPEMAYFEVCNELKLIVDLIYKKGIGGMYRAVSDTAKWGGLTVGPQIIDDHVEENMRKALAAVRDGSFAREWVEESRRGAKRFEELMAECDALEIERVGREIRRMSGLEK